MLPLRTRVGNQTIAKRREAAVVSQMQERVLGPPTQVPRAGGGRIWIVLVGAGLFPSPGPRCHRLLSLQGTEGQGGLGCRAVLAASSGRFQLFLDSDSCLQLRRGTVA